MYSLAVEKRGRIAYDDTRVLLGDLANGQPNFNTNVYGHYSLGNKVQVEKAAEPTAAGNDLDIVTRERHEARLVQAYALAGKRARRGNLDDRPDDDEAEIQGNDLVIAVRAAAARRVTSVHINDVIEQISSSQNLPRVTSPYPIMPSARAGKL